MFINALQLHRSCFAGLILARQWTLTSMMRKPVVHRYMTTQIDANTSDRESLVAELAAKLLPRNAFALAA